MRFIITSTTSETAAAPDAGKPNEDEGFDEATFIAYMKFNEDMQRAGVLVASEGLLPGVCSIRNWVFGFSCLCHRYPGGGVRNARRPATNDSPDGLGLSVMRKRTCHVLLV